MYHAQDTATRTEREDSCTQQSSRPVNLALPRVGRYLHHHVRIARISVNLRGHSHCGRSFPTHTTLRLSLSLSLYYTQSSPRPSRFVMAMISFMRSSSAPTLLAWPPSPESSSIFQTTTTSSSFRLLLVLSLLVLVLTVLYHRISRLACVWLGEDRY